MRFRIETGSRQHLENESLGQTKKLQFSPIELMLPLHLDMLGMIDVCDREKSIWTRTVSHTYVNGVADDARAFLNQGVLKFTAYEHVHL